MAEPCRGAFWELRSFRRGRQGNGLVYAARALEQHMVDVFAIRWDQRWHCIQPDFVRQLCTRFVCVVVCICMYIFVDCLEIMLVLFERWMWLLHFLVITHI